MPLVFFFARAIPIDYIGRSDLMACIFFDCLSTTIVISLYINAQKQFAAIFFKNHGFSFSDNAVIRLVNGFARYHYYAKTWQLSCNSRRSNVIELGLILLVNCFTTIR